jgi:hypothetical protein
METSFVTSLHRVIAVLDTLPACVVVCIAAWRSSCSEFDASVFLTGTAFAAPVFWRGHWSWSFLTRTAVTAYFFRCVAFYLIGTDAVRIMAFGDAGMGLAAIGSAYIVRRAIHEYAGQGGWAASQQVVREGGATTHGCCGGEEVGEEADGTGRIGQEEEADWSPLQFSLKAIFVFSLAWAGLLAVGVTGGPGVVYLMIFLGLLMWIIAGCIRLVLVGSTEDLAE